MPCPVQRPAEPFRQIVIKAACAGLIVAIMFLLAIVAILLRHGG